MRSAYALRLERKILETAISLHFSSQKDHISRPSHIFFIKNAAMSTPPSSPSVDHTAIADLQNAAAASTTHALPLRAGAATALAFSTTGKRHSTQDRDGTVSGASSPIKKRDNNVSVRLHDSAGEVSAGNELIGSATTPSLLTAIPSITPSPPTQEEDSVPTPIVLPTAPPKRPKPNTTRMNPKQSNYYSKLNSLRTLAGIYSR